jgi:glycosyltransferase involved in cell wall biosynthesis
MRIGVWKPQRDETSVRIYTDQIVQHLQVFGHSIFFFGKFDEIPEVDIIWDPTCTGAQYPNRKILQTSIPWIVTVHGAANLSLPLRYNFPSFAQKLQGLYINMRRKLMWSIYKTRVAHIITVSVYAKDEIVEYLNIPPNLISVIYHGYDDDLFYRQSGEKTYLLHVSVYQPKKNVDAVLEAYRRLPQISRLPLLLVCPGYPFPVTDKDVTLITATQTRKQIAAYMKEAYAFVFPSFHESFGMPLVEAMACGVPVITSNKTACPEIVKDAGLFVQPESVEDLQRALEKICTDKELRDSLAQHALERAKDFSWAKSARLHETVFTQQLNKLNR